MNPVGKAVEKIDPYDPLKNAEKPAWPGPGYYQTEIYKTIQKQTEKWVDLLSGVPQLTSSFITDNTDRWGKPIHNKTIKNDGPGPIKYSHPYSYLSEIGGVVPISPWNKPIHTNNDLGPGTYNNDKEPPKISFLLNQNNYFIP